MRIKRFIGSDRRRTMDRVRQEMGPDAVILSSRATEDGYCLVACDLDERLLEQQMREGAGEAVSLVMANAVRPGGDSQAIHSLQQELNQLRTFIEQELPRFALTSTSSGRGAERDQPLVARLQRFGFSATFAKTLYGLIGGEQDAQSAWRSCFARVQQKLRTDRMGDGILSGAVALLGPAGSGKTTSLCKLAARFQAELGSSAVAIVSMDTRRFGAHQQIGQFARFMQLDALQVGSWTDCQKALNRLAHKSLVLIDTPAVQNSQDLLACMAGLRTQGRPVRGLYCLPSPNSCEYLLAHSRLAKASGLTAVITQTDLCVSLAPVVEALARTQLPVGYITQGSLVHRGLRAAQSKEIMSLAVRKYRDSRLSVGVSSGDRQVSA